MAQRATTSENSISSTKNRVQAHPSCHSETSIIFTRSCSMALMLFEMAFVLALVIEMVLFIATTGMSLEQCGQGTLIVPGFVSVITGALP